MKDFRVFSTFFGALAIGSTAVDAVSVAFALAQQFRFGLQRFRVIRSGNRATFVCITISLCLTFTLAARRALAMARL